MFGLWSVISGFPHPYLGGGGGGGGGGVTGGLVSSLGIYLMQCLDCGLVYKGVPIPTWWGGGGGGDRELSLTPGYLLNAVFGLWSGI